MSMIVVRKLKPKWRQILKNGKYRDVMASAFIGAADGTVAQFGIGLMEEDGQTHFWELVTPHYLITAWRGMWLLDRVKRVKKDTLYAAYNLMDAEYGDEEYYDALAGQVMDLWNVRDGLLKAKIAETELDEMLKICNDANGIYVSTNELRRELEAGTICRTTELERTFELEAADTDRMERIKWLSEVALPKKQSFRRFCKELQIINLCDAPMGAYGIDWGHIDIKQIDRELVYEGLLRGWDRGIFCSTNSARSSNFGHIGHPVVAMSNGDKMVLEKVRYTEAGMQVRIGPIFADDTPGEWLPLAQARKRIQVKVGVTCGPFANVSDGDRRRGYVGMLSKRRVVRHSTRDR